jgi:hypothetical protein
MGDDDPRDSQLSDGPVDDPFGIFVEVARSFIEQEDTRGSVKRTCDHDALQLAPGKGAAHVAHQGLVPHGHTDDLFMVRGGFGRLLDSFEVWRRAETSDVVGDRAGEQAIILQHSADLATIDFKPDCLQRNIVEQHCPGRRSQQTREDFDQRRLACA